MIDAATFRLRYPALASLDDATITYWLTDAARIVAADWGDDQEPGTLALAAHSLTMAGAAPAIAGSASLPAGLTRFHSGGMDVSITETAANQTLEGGYRSTVYGREFLPMLRRNRGGPMLVGAAPCF